MIEQYSKCGNVSQTNYEEFLSEFKMETISLFSVLAASSIANIVKSSLGPVGLDKMLVDDIGVSMTFDD